MTNRRIVVDTLPQGALEESHFRLEDAPQEAMSPGAVRLRVILMSIDAANRSWMQGATYRAAVNAGDPMPTYAICEVIEARTPRFSKGDIVATEAVWADEVIRKDTQIAKLPKVARLENLLSVFGIAGKTAFHGLVSVGKPKRGETVLVSAAAGLVGGYVGQIAKALGCKVVGIAGGPEKCAWVTEHLGFDACVDYREGSLFKAIKAACPDGVDIYFDNVGGEMLETAISLMNERGRIVCCGAISQYESTQPTGPRNLPGMLVVKRLRMEGFIVMDFAKRDKAAIARLSEWVDAGKIKVEEDVVEGLENAPKALIGLLNGDNKGKRMVRVGPDPE